VGNGGKVVHEPCGGDDQNDAADEHIGAAAAALAHALIATDIFEEANYADPQPAALGSRHRQQTDLPADSASQEGQIGNDGECVEDDPDDRDDSPFAHLSARPDDSGDESAT